MEYQDKYTKIVIDKYKEDYKEDYKYKLYETYEDKEGNIQLNINKYNKKPVFNSYVKKEIIIALKESEDYKKYYESRLKLNRLYNKVTRKRKDKLNKVNNILMTNLDTLIIENLDLGKEKKKEKNSKRTRKMLQSSQFKRYISMIELVSGTYDKEVIKIEPHYTSSTCSSCLHNNSVYEKKLWRPKQDTFICRKCGYQINADINAAKNIFTVGTDLKETPHFRVG